MKPKPNYRIYDRTGGGVTEDIYAKDLTDAIWQGRYWIENGDWTPGTHEVTLQCEVGPIIYGPDGEEDNEATRGADREDCSGTLEPEGPPPCRDGCEHEWEAPFEVVGGIKENPGVWGSGHGSIVTKSVCRHCGIYCRTDYGATDSSNGTQCTDITYSDPDEASLAWVAENSDQDETPETT